MGSSILSEVDDTSILRTGLSTCYWHPLDWLPASRLLRPRSGLERSDFVPWPLAALALGVTTALTPKRKSTGRGLFLPRACRSRCRASRAPRHSVSPAEPAGSGRSPHSL